MIGLTYIRELHKMSMHELAKIVGVSKQSISKWENMQKRISDERLTQLAQIFGVDARYFSKQLTKEEELNLQVKKLVKESSTDMLDIANVEEDGTISRTYTLHNESEGVVQHINMQITKENLLRRVELALIEKGVADSIEKFRAFVEIFDGGDDLEKALLFKMLDAHLQNDKYKSMQFRDETKFRRDKENVFAQLSDLTGKYQDVWGTK